MQLSDRIRLRMKLHDLHVLMAVVQAGSMSKAIEANRTTLSACFMLERCDEKIGAFYHGV